MCVDGACVENFQDPETPDAPVPTRSECVLEIEYTVDGVVSRSTFTDYGKNYEEYTIGEDIDIYYKVDDIQNIYRDPSIIFDILFVFTLITLIFTIITTFVRVFYSDSTIVKWWIGLTCWQTISSFWRKGG